VLPATATAPVLALTQPAPAVVRGAVSRQYDDIDLAAACSTRRSWYVKVIVWPEAAFATFETLP